MHGHSSFSYSCMRTFFLSPVDFVLFRFLDFFVYLLICAVSAFFNMALLCPFTILFDVWHLTVAQVESVSVEYFSQLMAPGNKHLSMRLINALPM